LSFLSSGFGFGLAGAGLAGAGLAASWDEFGLGLAASEDGFGLGLAASEDGFGLGLAVLESVGVSCEGTWLDLEEAVVDCGKLHPILYIVKKIV
jgi:hypothetical protein